MNDSELNSDLLERFQRGSRQKTQSRNSPEKDRSHQNRAYNVKLNPKIRQYLKLDRTINQDSDVDKWKRATEIPTNAEVNLGPGDVVTLPANRIEKPYKSVERYLKTQYALLREDAVSPLRDALDAFKKNPGMSENQIANIYERVHITSLTYTQNGIATRIKFSTARIGKRIMWSSSKRLMSGSIVALSPSTDNFSTRCMVGTIAARPLALVDQNPPEIDIYFGRPEEVELDPHKEFVMVEAKSGYFEAHRYTLKALQQLSSETFPLSRHITAIQSDIEAPKYLTKNPCMDMSAIALPTSEKNVLRVNILEDWPDLSVTNGLDTTQLEALRQILTKNLSIIQGPPGTGKTHVSVIALKLLLQNRRSDDPPIIVASQTNHALDQLLEHIGDFYPEYVRLGGRSTSSEVKKRALYQIKQSERIPNVPGSGLNKSRKDLANLQKQLVQLLDIYCDRPEPMSAQIFHQLGVLTDKQTHSLESVVSDWVSADTDGVGAMQHWLHKSLIPFNPIYHEQDYGFEEAEEDLEFEQIKECEAEHGVTDEEDIEMLHGDRTLLFDRWTVVEPSSMDISKASQLLETCDDLWKGVPEYLRGATYWVMRQRATTVVLTKFRKLVVEYNRLVQEIKIGRWEKDAVYLARANIIGMTTTGLSKYRGLIASLEPKIILIEEAAEILEAPVAVACVESLQHLILVGDHLQLRGHCAVSDLEGPDYNLNVSMFERLVKLNMPFKTLLRQRRMRPEFRELISSLYPKLIDHPGVLLRYPPDWGTGQIRSFFFTHQWLEAKDESLSTFNEQEASMVAKLYGHLVLNDVPPPAITILTFYNGHRKKILKAIRDDAVANVAYVNVKTVDSYQGKESSIIILSLARNNLHNSIGFLENANRVCVALSRARDGFYIFGNANLVCRNPLWHDVVSQMTVANRIGDKFPIRCARHGKVVNMQYPTDWEIKSPAGGCNEICGGKLACGHICKSICHGCDHSTMSCQETCNKQLVCGHDCDKKCRDRCSCTCPDYERLVMKAIRAQSGNGVSRFKSVHDPTQTAGPHIQCHAVQQEDAEGHWSRLDSEKVPKKKKNNTEPTIHGEQMRSAGQVRSRFVSDFHISSTADTTALKDSKKTDGDMKGIIEDTKEINLLE